MQNSIAPSGTPTVPAYLRELPESPVESLPVETRIPELPCDQLSWRDFERLVYRLVRKNADVVYCAPYGRPGQIQDGIDVYARLSGGRHECWQARNRKDVHASDIKKAVDDFLNGKWAASAERFVLCVRASLADTALQDTIPGNPPASADHRSWACFAHLRPLSHPTCKAPHRSRRPPR